MTDPATGWRIAAVAAASLLPLSAALAEPTIADLLQRIEEQDQKILALQRKLDAQEQQDQQQQDQKLEEQEQKVLVLERKLEIQEEADKAARRLDAGRQGEPARLLDPVGRRPEPGQVPRRAAGRRPLHDQRRSAQSCRTPGR